MAMDVEGMALDNSILAKIDDLEGGVGAVPVISGCITILM